MCPKPAGRGALTGRLRGHGRRRAAPPPGGGPGRHRLHRQAGPFAAIYGLAAGLTDRHPEKANRLSAWGFRRALPAAVAEAVVAGGLACEIAPQVVDAVTAMNPPTPLLDYPGPVWLVNAARDHFRRDERDFLRACRDGRLSVCPGHNHITLLADTAILARIVLDAVVVAEAATLPARRTTTPRSCAPGPLAAPRREAATVPGVGGWVHPAAATVRLKMSASKTGVMPSGASWHANRVSYPSGPQWGCDRRAGPVRPACNASARALGDDRPSGGGRHGWVVRAESRHGCWRMVRVPVLLWRGPSRWWGDEQRR